MVAPLAADTPAVESLAEIRDRFIQEEKDKTSPPEETKEETPSVERPEEEPEAEESKEEEAEEDKEPAAELPEGWDQHEIVLERLKSAQDEGYNKAKSHLTRAHNATLTEIEETHQGELSQAATRALANQALQTFSEAIGELDLDDNESIKQVTKLLHANESWARVFFDSAERGAATSLVNLITNDERWTRDLPEDDVDDFNATVSELSLKLRKNVAAAKSRDDILKANAAAINTYLEERDKLRDKKVVAEALAKESTRLETAARKAAGLSDKAASRGTKSPPAKPSGAAGAGDSRTEEEILTDPRTPINVITEIRARQKAG